MRVLLAIGAIQIYWREEKRSEAISLLKDLRGMLVDVGEFELCDKRIRSFFEDSIRSLETDPAADALDRIASDDEELSRPVQCIPTMVSAGRAALSPFASSASNQSSAQLKWVGAGQRKPRHAAS